MRIFLTSNILSYPAGPINSENGFCSQLCSSIAENSDYIFIASNPDNHQNNDVLSDDLLASFEKEGVFFGRKYLIDSRNPELASKVIGTSENQLLVFSKGDVVNQNKFMRSIGMKNLLKDFKGTIVAAGGGAMNCSSILYLMPKTVDQMASTDFLKFIPGIGLSQRSIIPHFERVITRTIGSKSYFSDIILSDSMGKSFFALPEKSFIKIEDGFETIHGPIWHISDGEVSQL